MSKTTPLALALALTWGFSPLAMADPAPAPAAARQADVAIARAELEALRLLGLLDRSRLQRDAVRVACVDTQLSRINSFRRTLTARRGRILSAIARRSARDVAHERRAILRLTAQIRAASRAGRACLDAHVEESDRTIVEVISTPDMAVGLRTWPLPRRD